MIQFDRQYRLTAGAAGGVGFEIGATTKESPTALHINFSIEKADTETGQNTHPKSTTKKSKNKSKKLLHA